MVADHSTSPLPALSALENVEARTAGRFKPRPGALIFDLDGVLLDSAPTVVAILNAMRHARGGSAVLAADVRPYLSSGGLALVSLGLGRHARDAPADLSEFRERYKLARHGPADVYDTVPKTLQELKCKNFLLGICTNKPQVLVTEIMRSTGLREWIDVVVADDGSYPPKPSPSPLLACCHSLNIPPLDALFIGDSEVDKDAAASAKVPFVWATYGYPASASAMARNALRIDRFDDLLGLVETIDGADEENQSNQS